MIVRNIFSVGRNNFEIIANGVVYTNFKKAEAAISWKIGFSKKLFAFRLLINLSVYWFTIFYYQRNHQHSFEGITTFLKKIVNGDRKT